MSDLSKDNLKKFLIAFIPIIAFSYFSINYYHNTLLQKEASIIINAELNELQIKKIILDDFFTSLVEDINILSSDYNYTSNHNKHRHNTTSQDLHLHLSSYQKKYDQVRLLDTLGNETFRLDFDDVHNYKAAPENQLQNKSDRYYFKSASLLKRDEIYFSRIDLNKEQNQIEVPYNPVIRVAKKLYSSQGHYVGIVISNHFIKNLASKLINYDDNASSEFELVNADGYWIIANDDDKTFGHSLANKSNINIHNLSKDLWISLQTNAKGHFKITDFTYVFLEFEPSIRTSNNSKCVFEETKKFYLLSKIPNRQLSKNHSFYALSKWLTLLFISILSALIILGIQYSTQKLKHKNQELKRSEAKLSVLKDKLQNSLKIKLEELAITEGKFYSLFNNAGIGVTLVSLDSKLEYSNKQFCDILGYTSEELRSKTILDITHPEDQEKDEKLIAQLLERKISAFNVEKRYIRKDGKVIWGDVNASIILNNKNEIINLVGTIAEITDKKANEATLFDNAQLLDQVFGAVISLDKQHSINYWNKGAFDLFGYQKNEVTGQNFGLLLTNDNGDKQNWLSKNFKEEEDKVVTEAILLRKDGRRFHAQLSLSNRINKAGEIIGSIASIIDISIRKAYEKKILQVNDALEKRVEQRTKELVESYEKIKENEYRLNAAFESGGYGWWDYHVEQDKFHLHQSRFKNLGYDKTDLVNHLNWWTKIMHKDDVLQFSKQIKAIINGEISKINHELRLKHANGHYIWFYTQGTVFEHDNKGKPKRIIGTYQNINQRKVAELEQLKLSKAVEQSPVNVIITDTKGNIEYVNPAFEELTGFKSNEVIGNSTSFLNEQIVPENVCANLWHTIYQGDTWEGELYNKTKSGRMYWETVIISPIKNENGEIINFIAIKEDNTEKRKFIEQLKSAKKEAEEANKAKSQFLANMSHEIRTPMNAVIGFTDILMRKVKDKTQQQYLHSIKSSGKNLLAIINDILDLSKIESGKMGLDYVPIKINDLLNELNGIFETQASEKGLHLNIQTNDNVCDTIYSDEVRIRQILINLIANAIKFTEKGFVSISVEKEVSINNNDQSCYSNLLFIIEDSGIGIKKEMQKKIFESFMQQDIKDTRKYGGTGLGLAISKRLANLLGGDILIESEYNKGSKFTFSLNSIKCMQSKSANDSIDAKARQIYFKPKNILIVDDIGSNRDYMESALNELGLEVIKAINGKEGLMALHEEKVDLIMCDIKMPELDGYGFIKELRSSSFKNIPCIATTASALNNEFDKINQHKFNGVLIKPIQLNELILELKKFLPYEYIEIKHKQSDELKALTHDELALINQDINAQIIPLYKSLLKRQSFEDLNKFALLINEIGNNTGITKLSNFSNQLSEAISSFNIKEILALLDKFSGLIDLKN